MATTSCHHCHAAYTPRACNARYCGTTCQRRAYNARRKADGRLKAYRQRPHVQARQAAWMAQHRDNYGTERQCLACGTTFRTRHDSRYCTRHCARWAQATRVQPIPDEHPSRSTAIPYCRLLRRQRKARFAGAHCRHCTTTFVMDRMQNHSLTYMFCTERCSRQHHKQLRDYRQRSTTSSTNVGRITIFKRDGWICGICGHKVRRNAPANHPLSPTLDHIIPLARGGTHEPRNVQCAHRHCNATKGDRGGGEQLALL